MKLTADESVHWLGRVVQSTKCINATLTNSNTIARLSDLADYITKPYINRETDNSTPLVMTAGNGGSHALAEHLTGELIWRVGKGKDKNIRIPSICLTSNSTVLTAISNDVSYTEALSYYAGTMGWLRHCKEMPQVLIAFSTSNHDKNILDLLETTVYDCIVHRVLFTGPEPKEELPAEEVFYIKGSTDLSTSIIQEVHQVYVHILCEMISERLKNV